MLEFAHAVTGGFIAGKINNPYVALPLALISHFVIDLLPHWNPSILKEKQKYGHLKKKTLAIIFFDSCLGLFFGLVLAFGKFPDINQMLLVLGGCFMGILPDLVEAPFFLLNNKYFSLKPLIKFQSSHQFNVSFEIGMLFQILFTLLLLLLAF